MKLSKFFSALRQFGEIAATKSRPAQRPKVSRRSQARVLVAPSGPSAAIPVPSRCRLTTTVGEFAFQKIQRRGRPLSAVIGCIASRLIQKRTAKTGGFAIQTDMNDGNQRAEHIGRIGGCRPFADDLQQNRQRHVIIAGVA